jgi:hypothetical protein
MVEWIAIRSGFAVSSKALLAVCAAEKTGEQAPYQSTGRFTPFEI